MKLNQSVSALFGKGFVTRNSQLSRVSRSSQWSAFVLHKGLMLEVWVHTSQNDFSTAVNERFRGTRQRSAYKTCQEEHQRIRLEAWIVDSHTRKAGMAGTVQAGFPGFQDCIGKALLDLEAAFRGNAPQTLNAFQMPCRRKAFRNEFPAAWHMRNNLVGTPSERPVLARPTSDMVRKAFRTALCGVLRSNTFWTLLRAKDYTKHL